MLNFDQWNISLVYSSDMITTAKTQICRIQYFDNCRSFLFANRGLCNCNQQACLKYKTALRRIHAGWEICSFVWYMRLLQFIRNYQIRQADSAHMTVGFRMFDRLIQHI